MTGNLIHLFSWGNQAPSELNIKVVWSQIGALLPQFLFKTIKLMKKQYAVFIFRNLIYTVNYGQNTVYHNFSLLD